MSVWKRPYKGEVLPLKLHGLDAKSSLTCAGGCWGDRAEKQGGLEREEEEREAGFQRDGQKAYKRLTSVSTFHSLVKPRFAANNLSFLF